MARAGTASWPSGIGQWLGPRRGFWGRDTAGELPHCKLQARLAQQPVQACPCRACKLSKQAAPAAKTMLGMPGQARAKARHCTADADAEKASTSGREMDDGPKSYGLELTEEQWQPWRFDPLLMEGAAAEGAAAPQSMAVSAGRGADVSHIELLWRHEGRVGPDVSCSRPLWQQLPA